MIDLNTLVSNALIAAVQQAIAPLNERIANLEAQSADCHQRLLALEGALTDRVVALENNPAQGVDTSVIAGNYTPISNEQAMQHIIDALSDTDHPLFKRLSSFMDAVAEQAVDDHCSTYDHDDYDSAVSKVDDLPDLDDYVTRDEVRSEIEDVLNNATLSLSI